METVLWVCGAIATILGAAAAINKNIIQPLNIMNKRLDKVEELAEGQKVLGKALCQMMEHTITGNNIEELKKEYHELRDYFINH